MTSAARIGVCIALLIVLSGPVGSAQARQPSFLRDADRGSAAVYNPLVQVTNEGFDILQWVNHERRLGHIPFERDASTVLDNLGHPFRAIRDFGTRDFVTHELLPLGLDDESGQWIPNYTLHLIGGGIAHSALTEWFTKQGVEHPWAWSTGVFMGQSLLNEMMENNGRGGMNVDAIADVFVFNPAAVALFSSERVRKFFATSLNASIWGLQPTFTPRDGSVRNTGQYYALKWRLPRTRNLYLFQQFGLGSLTGLSAAAGRGYHVTLAVGYRTYRDAFVDEVRGLKTVDSAPVLGFFLDEGHSLLASVLVSDIPDELLYVNLYPGLIPGRFAPGLWVVVADDGTPTVGIVTRWGLGIGH